MRLIIIGAMLGLASVAVADPSEAARLLATARNLATNGYCEAVKDVGKRVKSLDETYYDTAFRTDPVIISCGPIEQSPSEVTPVDRPHRHGFTADVEIGGGAGEYTGDTGGFGLMNGSTNGESTFDLGAGVGAFVKPRVAIGVRGLAAFSHPTNLTYTPPLSGVFEAPAPSPYTVHTSLSHEIVLGEVQGWAGDNFWAGFGLGYGRVDLAPNPNSSSAGSGLATDFRVGVAASYGFEASFEVTSIIFSSNATGPSSQVSFAFLLGWQLL